MATRIVFDNGLELSVAQDRAAVVEALRRDGPEAVRLESRGGRPLTVNMRRAIAIGGTLNRPPRVF